MNRLTVHIQFVFNVARAQQKTSSHHEHGELQII